MLIELVDEDGVIFGYVYVFVCEFFVDEFVGVLWCDLVVLWL